MNDNNIIHTLEKLEKQITHDENVVEIKHLLRKYAMHFNAGDSDGIMGCFSCEHEDIEVIFGHSKVAGRKALTEYYSVRPKIARLPGTFVTHEINSEVIAISKDGKTARIIADASGVKGIAPAGSQVRLLGKYYFDVVKEAGGWKIWHLQWILTADADFNYGWLFQNRAYYIEDNYPALSEEPHLNMNAEAADAYVDYFKPDEVQILFPEPPQEYETWDGYQATNRTRGY